MNTGCTYVISTSKKWNGKTKRFDDINNHCHKLTAENQQLCPKHLLFVEDEKEEAKRKSTERIRRENLKALEDEALAASPLAAVNEEYKGKVVAPWLHGYSK